ncbi:MAG TPA: chromosome segregation protein SMC, partial [Burkholderiales bacterium]|nr:chromosome segregation protein SMC [Burkholderiales bacterium]
MRLKQINLAGFKSFVDPTHIPVPGQLVGIVGPNGCGKSNVIDAVRWVLGETSAKHLRGDTMQDILFNGSGQRQPVNRSSVELIFDNSLGRAGGQWSSYAEISVKRVLARDGEATSYYINNTHVRRRDVADIFLGTGLGSRAYAIIEQGMISRVIEAKPEELRVFLEEAAGVSRYRERRRETEHRLKDTRENLARVNDVRAELEKQLEHLQSQAEVATRYHDLQARVRAAQNLLYLLRKQEAAAQRGRHRKEIERLALELESETSRLRDAEKRLEDLRSQHYRGSDAVHAAQGAFYEANAETARLEQELAHLRDNRQRVERDLADLRAQVGQGQEQLAAAQASLAVLQGERARATENVAARDAAVQSESDKLPVAEEAFRATRNRYEEFQRALALAEQAMGVEHTKRGHARQTLEQLGSRARRLQDERLALQPGDAPKLEQLRNDIAALEHDLHALRSDLAAEEDCLPTAEQALRDRDAAHEAAGQRVAGLEARLQALTQLQERLARGANTKDWLEARGLGKAPRLWQQICIESGWEDALEAALRERLNAIALERMEQAGEWLSGPPPGRITAFVPSPGSLAPAESLAGCDSLRRFVTCNDSRLQAVLEDWLHQIYVIPDAAAALAARERLPAGAMLVTPEGHIFTRHTLSFHAPDSELHGVLSRQREIEQLAHSLSEARAGSEGSREAAAAAEREVLERRSRLDELRDAINDRQQRHHALQMEALQLTELDQRVTQRIERIAAELAEIETQSHTVTAGEQAAERRVAELEAEVGELGGQLTVATDLYRRAETVLELQRNAVQEARESAHQALFNKQSCDNKIIEIEHSIKVLSENALRLETAVGARLGELAGFDEAPLQERLQHALAARAEREQALAGVRDALEGLESALKETDEERHAVEQRLEPLRERIAE